MRHLKAGKKLKRNVSARRALLRVSVAAVLANSTWFSAAGMLRLRGLPAARALAGERR